MPKEKSSGAGTIRSETSLTVSLRGCVRSHSELFPDEQDRWAMVPMCSLFRRRIVLSLRLSDYRAGVIDVSRRLDENGRVRR